MNYDEFRTVCESVFAGLIMRYGFRRPTAKRESGGIYKYNLTNSTTGLRVLYEQKEHQIYVQICRLIGNRICPEPGEIRPGSVLHCYSLDDLLALRKPGYEASLLESPPGPDDSLSSAIRASATDIETYATDILLGDFAVFECLDRVVKDRARQAAYAKWGERAREFGWQ